MVAIILCFFGSIITAQCLNKKEREKLILAIEELLPYQDVPNYIKCNGQQTYLEKFVCDNEDYLLMFKLLSIANVYAYENATKREVDHNVFNKEHMGYWEEKYDSDSISAISLFYDIKIETTNLLGGISPYEVVNIKGDIEGVFILQKNEHGMILSNRNGYRIYIGVSNDVRDSKKNKGIWRKEKNKYYAEIDGGNITFSFEEYE